LTVFLFLSKLLMHLKHKFMAKLRRRDILSLGLLTAGGMTMSGCCCLLNLFVPESDLGEKYCNPLQDWKDDGSSWWEDRQEQREREREAAIAAGERPELEKAFPYLTIGRVPTDQGWLGDQTKNIPMQEWGYVSVAVQNHGSASSWNCIVEMFEAPYPGAYGTAFSTMRLTGRSIISLHPGETKFVPLRWQKTRQSGGCVVRIFDPVWDAPLMTYLQYDRKDTGVGWRQ
jgi:hypothetical protein